MDAKESRVQTVLLVCYYCKIQSIKGDGPNSSDQVRDVK